MDNEKVEVDGLQIVGVHDREAGDSRQIRALLRQPQLDGSRAIILLAHQPPSLAIAEEAGCLLTNYLSSPQCGTAKPRLLGGLLAELLNDPGSNCPNGGNLLEHVSR
ncbi:MAG: hypothetical protein ABSH48_14085 [Verrucomicrobiota bacterium]